MRNGKRCTFAVEKTEKYRNDDKKKKKVAGSEFGPPTNASPPGSGLAEVDKSLGLDSGPYFELDARFQKWGSGLGFCEVCRGQGETRRVAVVCGRPLSPS